MRKNYLFTAALFVAALTSCSQDEQLSLANEDKSVFTGSMEVIGSRTELNEKKVVWKGDETISIFEMDNVNAQYKVTSLSDGKATFEFVNYIPLETITPLKYNYAVYPYSEANTIDANGNIYAPVSDKYTFTDRASSIATALMVAKAEDTHFNFTNAQGIICLRLNAQRPDKLGAIQSIKLTSSSNLLSGTAMMTWGEDNAIPIAEIQEGGGQELTINLSDNNKIELPASQDGKYAEFYVPVVPTKFEVNDLTLEIKFANSEEAYEATIPGAFEVERKEIQYLKHTIGTSIVDGVIEDNLTEIVDIASAHKLDETLETAFNGILNFTSFIDYAKDSENKDGAIDIPENSDVTLNNLSTKSGSAGDYGLIARPASKVTINDANIESLGGGIAVIDGAEVTFNSGSLAVNSTNTSGRYNFYVVGEGSKATINGGEFSFSKTLNQKRAYIYVGAGATVYVNGGKFGPASSRDDYTAGILGDGTVIITGGTFGFDPSAWVADGYAATNNGDTWTVAAK